MAKKATTLHDILGNDLLPVTNASITFMDNGTSVQAEIIDLKLKTQYNKGHYITPEELNSVYPSTYPDGTTISNEDSKLREGWYAVVGSTDTMWIWDVQGKEWVNSGSSIGAVESVNGLDGEVILTGSNINATATIDTTSTTKSINGHLNDIYADLENTVDLNSSQLITGTKVFTEVIGLANTSEGTVDQIKHINSNFLITSGTGQNLLNIDEGLEKISAFNRELAYEDEIQQIQGDYATKDELSQEIQNVTDMIPTDNSELTNGANYATEQYVEDNFAGLNKSNTFTEKIYASKGINANNSISLIGYEPSSDVLSIGSFQNETYIQSNTVPKWANLNTGGEPTVVNLATTNDIPDTSGFVTTNTTQKITGAKVFSGTVGNTQTESGIYLGLDQNTGAENANMAIVSANTASYIDMGRPNVDYDFRIIKWNMSGNTNAQLVYGGNASGTITIPQATGVMALTSDIPKLVTLTQAEYDALSTKDTNTYYFIKEE